MITTESIQKDIRSLFDKFFLQTSDSDLILGDIETEFTVYSSLDDILDGLQKNVYKGKKASIVKAISDDINRGDPIEEVFFRYGLITQEEILIFSDTTSIRDSIKMTLEFREEGNKFPLFFFKVFFPILAFSTACIFLMRFLGELLVKYVREEIEPKFRIKTGFQPDIEFPYIMQNLDVATFIVIGWVFLIILAFYFYHRVYEKEPYLIYKISEIKFYDDFIRYFTIADKMKKVQSTPDKIMEYFAEKAKPLGLRSMFKEMFLQGTDYHITLEKFNCPQRLTSIVRRLENNSTFWDNMETQILAYAKNARNKKVVFYTKYFSGTLFIAGVILLIITLGSLIGSTAMTVWILVM